MEKAKKVLYLIAGILKFVGGGLVGLLGLLMLLVSGVVRKVFESSMDSVKIMIEGLAEAEEEFAYLLDMGLEEQIDFIMNVCRIFAVVLIILAIVYIVIGVFNIKFYKRTGTMVKEGAKSVWLCIVSWLLSFLALSTILTTVAACLKVKGISSSDNVVIEHYHV